MHSGEYLCLDSNRGQSIKLQSAKCRHQFKATTIPGSSDRCAIQTTEERNDPYLAIYGNGELRGGRRDPNQDNEQFTAYDVGDGKFKVKSFGKNKFLKKAPRDGNHHLYAYEDTDCGDENGCHFIFEGLTNHAGLKVKLIKLKLK